MKDLGFESIFKKKKIKKKKRKEEKKEKKRKKRCARLLAAFIFEYIIPIKIVTLKIEG